LEARFFLHIYALSDPLYCFWKKQGMEGEVREKWSKGWPTWQTFAHSCSSQDVVHSFTDRYTAFQQCNRCRCRAGRSWKQPNNFFASNSSAVSVPKASSDQPASQFFYICMHSN
jgi:hypothetical protein